MRFLEICLLFDGLFHYFSQLQAVDFIGEGSSCNEKLLVKDLVTGNNKITLLNESHAYYKIRGKRLTETINLVSVDFCQSE